MFILLKVYTAPRHWLLALASAIYVMLVILAIQSAEQVLKGNAELSQKELKRQKVAVLSAKLQAAIYKDTFVADSLATLVTIDPTTAVQKWEQVAHKLISKAEYARNVGLAPDDVISYVYPLAGNERALGFDFRTNPEQWRTVSIARENQEMFLAGTLTLIQGGQGLIARFPVFTDYPVNSQYWGTVSVVFDFTRLLNDILVLEDDSISIALRGKDGLGESGAVFYGNPMIFDSPDSEVVISLPHGEWLMAARYQFNPSIAGIDISVLVWSVGLFLAAMLYAAAFFTLSGYQLARKMSLHDELTDLPNRRYMYEHLDALIKTNGRRARFTLVSIDLNRFKEVNDTYGHQAGDLLLQHVSKRLLQTLRGTDVVVRMGGDEFLIILHRLVDEQHIEEKVAAIKHAVEHAPIEVGNEQLYPSLSCGYARYTGQLIDIESLMSIADKHMYNNKKRTQSD